MRSKCVNKELEFWWATKQLCFFMPDMACEGWCFQVALSFKITKPHPWGWSNWNWKWTECSKTGYFHGEIVLKNQLFSFRCNFESRWLDLFTVMVTLRNLPVGASLLVFGSFLCILWCLALFLGVVAWVNKNEAHSRKSKAWDKSYMPSLSFPKNTDAYACYTAQTLILWTWPPWTPIPLNPRQKT